MNNFMIASDCLKSMVVVGGVTCISYYIVHSRNTLNTQSKLTTPQTNKNTKVSFQETNQIIPPSNPVIPRQVIPLDHPEYVITIGSNETSFSDVARYIYHLNQEGIHSFFYDERKMASVQSWRNRKKEKAGYLKIMMPYNESFAFMHEFQETHYQIEGQILVVKDHRGDEVKLQELSDMGHPQDIIYERIELRTIRKDVLMHFVDEAKQWSKDIHSSLKASVKDSLNVFYYKKDFWMLLSKTPKRSLDTIYLKKGEKENIMERVSTFFSPETRDVYLSFGIPYKNTVMIHGPPGTGKTSVIKSIASTLDCDLYILPITKDMLDNDLVDAFSYINDNEEKERIIVIEDVDTLFDDRKDGDTQNGITLQGFLNCMDGFTSVEGTMLFITANRPQVLDYAMIRSCRIDHKIELTYADKYQTQHMFERFFPTQTNSFNEFYQSIKHKEYTTAMLQEFFFYNRDSENILSLLDLFHGIVEKNDPKHFEVIKDENKNCYM